MSPSDGAPTARERSQTPMTLARAQRLTGVTLDNADLTQLMKLVQTAPWMGKVGPAKKLEPGELTRGLMKIPQGEAQTALRGVRAHSAGVRRGASMGGVPLASRLVRAWPRH